MRAVLVTHLETQLRLSDYQEAKTLASRLTDIYFQHQSQDDKLSKSQLKSMTLSLFRGRLTVSLWEQLGATQRYKSRLQLTRPRLFDSSES